MLNINDMTGKIYCGDCLEVMKQMPDKCVDLVLTDPPYGIERFKNVGKETSGCFAKKGTFANSEAWNNNKPNEEYFREIFRISKNQIIWGGNNFGLPPTEYFIVWNKFQAMPNFAECEYAWVGGDFKKPAKIFNHPISKVNQSGRQHPTQKPLELFEYIFKEYAKENWIIFDPYLGSGTTAVAAERLGRRWIGIEMEPKYCAIAQARVDAERNQLKLPGIL